jgi:hypothetical protein
MRVLGHWGEGAQVGGRQLVQHLATTQHSAAQHELVRVLGKGAEGA